jgi:DUF4097 and DUF4098 domain-containing protein YvlB
MPNRTCTTSATPLTIVNVLILICALSLVAVLPVLGAQTVDETRRVDRDAAITIKTLAGSVTVTGWNRQEVKVTGTLDDQAEELVITGDSKQLSIEVKYPERVKNLKDGSHLTIQVPSQGSVDVGTVSATIAIDKVEGSLEARSVSGAVTLRGKPSAVRAETVSGKLDLDAATDRARLSCVSGTITVAGVRRDLSCRAVSGNIRIAAGKDLAALQCEVISGDITVAGQLPRKAEWDLSAHSGNVQVDLAGKVDARLRLKTFSGKIHDVFGHQAERTSRYAPGQQLSVTEGSGDALLTVDVFSGEIRVQKK